MSILSEIFAQKHCEVIERKKQRPPAVVRAEAEKALPALDFIAAIKHARGERQWPGLIAEVKYASPSKGKLLERLSPSSLAYLYACNGAAAISVLTDEKYFQGSPTYLRQIAASQPRLPLLCKDFIFDPYQIWEARANGADAILLITAALTTDQLCALQDATSQSGMAALVEVHSEAELEKALACSPQLIGINNRDLGTFTVSLDTTRQLRPLVPPGIPVVSESGFHTREDVLKLEEDKIIVDGILVGEALVTAEDIASKVRELAGVR